MGSDNQWTALGPAIVGFQTDSTNIDHGAEISGNSLGILGHCDHGNGVHGQSGSPTDSGVWGENTGSGFGVAGSSVSGEGILGDGRNGVHGRSRSPSDSGVWGENTGTGFGVSGSSLGVGVFGSIPGGVSLSPGIPTVGVWGTTVLPETFAESADGILGEGKNGVHGRSRSPSDSGVWGENTGSGVGVGGSSTAGYGGQFSGAFAPLYLTPSASTGHPTSGNHKRGEFYVDSSGSLFYCNTDGMPGHWIQLA